MMRILVPTILFALTLIVVRADADETDSPDAKLAPRRVSIPALLKMDEEKQNADRVREVQKTVAERLAIEKTVSLVIKKRIKPSENEDEDAPIRVVVQVDDNEEEVVLLLPGKSVVAKERGSDGKTAIRLPDDPDDILKVDGIYGQKTFSAIYLFQETQGLDPTGEVDALTLERLEPLIPPNPLIATVMIRLKKEGLLVQDPLWVKREVAFLVTVLILVISLGVYQIAKSLTGSTVFLSKWIFTPTSSPWFTTLKEKKFFLRMAHFAPAAFIYFSASLFPAPIKTELDPFPYLNVFETWHEWIERLGLAYGAVVLTWVGMAFVDACDKIYTEGEPEDNPIESVVRAARRFVLAVGLILICSAVADQSPLKLVAGLGAFMAVLMLVFKDAIVGLAATVQILGHKMVKLGDWIEMPKYGVDGFVTDMSLTTIKVQNFDKTIASIPTHAVLTDSFKNWRGMQESGGRRIKRSILIDMNTVKPCDNELCDRFEGMDLIRDYIIEKREQLRNHMLTSNVSLSPVNGRWLTNIGTFRAYVEAYLEWHPKINTDQTCLVRHLPSTSDGLPMEIYCFCTETSLADYERVQADIFDHLLSVLPEFDLRVFQNPREFDYEHVEKTYRHRIDERTFGVTDGQKPPVNLNDLEEFIAQQNEHLASNSRARVDVALRKIQDKIDQDGLDGALHIRVDKRRISLEMN